MSSDTLDDSKDKESGNTSKRDSLLKGVIEMDEIKPAGDDEKSQQKQQKQQKEQKEQDDDAPHIQQQRMTVTDDALTEAQKQEIGEIKLLNPREANEITLQLLHYLLFLSIFTVVIFFARNNEYPYYMTTDLDVYLAQNTGYYDMGSVDDFWAFMPAFFAALYNPEFYIGKNQSLGNVYILGTTRLLGAIRLRQLRVAPNRCNGLARYRDDMDCYAIFSEDANSKQDISTDHGTDLSRFDSPYGNSAVFHTNAELRSASFWGTTLIFPGGGFVQNFGSNISLNNEILSNLQAVEWIDVQTRVVFIEMSVYNQNIDMFSVITYCVEFLPSGGVAVSSQYLTMPFPIYDNNVKKNELGFELVLLMLVVYYMSEIIYTMYWYDKYFDSWWDWIDLLNYALFLFDFVFRIYIVLKIQDFKYHLDPPSDEFLPLYPVGVQVNAENYVVAFNIFLSYFKIFKYLQLSFSLNQMILVLRNGSRDFVNIFIIFAIVFVGYAVCGCKVFGTQVWGWRTFTQSMSTLFRAITEANMDYDDLYATNRIFAGLYYTSYYMLVYFVLFNMFVAVIWESFDNIKQLPQRQDIDIHSLRFYWRQRMRNIYYSHRPAAFAKFDDYVGVKQPTTVANRIANKYVELEKKKHHTTAHIHASTVSLPHADSYKISLLDLANDIALEAQMSQAAAEKLAKNIFDDYHRLYNGTLTATELEDWSYRLNQQTLHHMRHDGPIMPPSWTIDKEEEARDNALDNQDKDIEWQRQPDKSSSDNADSGKNNSGPGSTSEIMQQILKEMQELKKQNAEMKLQITSLMEVKKK